MNAKSEVAARVILLAFGLIAGLAIMELAMRLLGESSEVGDLRGLHELRLDRPWLYGLRAGADGVMPETGEVRYRVNADGFRGRRYARPKPPGTFRVLVLGDSISFGYGVEEEQTFSHLMEARLQQLVTDRPVEVVNLGVGGYNPYNELALLADVGASYQPDLVLVQFCINDLNDPTLHFDWQTRIRLATIPDAAFPDPSLRRVAAARSWPLLRACRRSKLCSLIDRLLLAATEPEPEMEELRAAVMPIEDTGAREWGLLPPQALVLRAGAYCKESVRGNVS